MQIKVRIQQRGNKTLNFFQKRNQGGGGGGGGAAGWAYLYVVGSSEAGCWWDAETPSDRASELRRWPLIVGAIGQLIVPRNKRAFTAD